ncbi:MAG TPA: amino acid adenylation domain-containing protein, partial [Polyangiaceae bacterium]
MLIDDDKKTVLFDWNATHAAFPDACAHTLFEEQAKRSPSAVAVVSGDRTMTFAELDERADRVAGYLRANGVGRESLVGVALDRSPELVVALLGVWKAGAAYVPLDPSYPRERLAFMVGDAGVKLLLTQSRHASLFESHEARTVCLDDDWTTVAAMAPLQPRPAPDSSTLAYVMYTSGSTGQPKGAMIVHSGLVNYLTWAVRAYGVTAGGSVPVHSSIAFDLTVTSLFPALIAGGQIELLGEDVGAQRLIAALRERPGRALVKITPAHLEVITQQLRPEELRGLTQVFVIGGENLPAESLRPWRERAPDTRLINEYGPTETVVGCCIHEVQSGDPDHGPVPIGRPIANTQLYILDEERRPVGIGVMGELYIGGAGVARGYLNRPELTRERFLPDPFSERPGARLYKTGDLARYRTDGTLEFLGRADHQVKVRGYRIELGEIEAVLARHADVQSCVVLAREDTPGDKQLVAYVVARPGRRVDVDALHAFATAHLPEYMAPAHHVLLDELPLTSNGKVDRKALPAPSARREAAAPVATPADTTEAAIAAILAGLLKVPALGSNDDFFDKGGHSLLAIKAVARIRDELGVDLPPQTLFEHSTPAALAARVALERGESPAPAHGIPPRKASGPAPASEGQQQLWLIDQVVPGSPAYNIVDVVTLRGKYDAGALSSALSDLVRRHEVLRTGLSQDGGQLVQTIGPAFTPSFEEHDLAAASEEERLRRWSLLARELGRRPFDLSRSPLFRAVVVHMSPGEHRLLLAIHHVVADEWSLDLIQKEVAELYAAHLHGRTPALSPLPIQYADYAAWEQDSLASDVRRTSIEYWKKELSGAITALALPVDKRRPSTPTMAGAIAPFDLPGDLLEGLKALCRREQTTLFMLLEAAFAALMHRYSGQDDVLVGTPISSRNHSETQGLVGYFLNTLVLRSRFPEDATFRTLLRRTRETALGAFAHADLPFSRLVAAMAPARDTSRSPLFQVMFVLHGPDGVSQLAKLADRGELETGTSKFDLTLYTSETGAGLAGLFEY